MDLEVKTHDETPDWGVGGEAPVFSVSDLSVHYGPSLALKDVNMVIRPRRITAVIGPSGCGKSTLIRCFNRMNELIPGTVHFESPNPEIDFESSPFYVVREALPWPRRQEAPRRAGVRQGLW